MYYCPTCRIPLKKSSNKFGIFWACPSCNGRATSIHVLRKAIPQEIVNKLWQRAMSGQYEKYRICPVCRKDLPEVPVITNEKTICLDVCTKCCFVWFDFSEYESLPKVEIPKPIGTELPQETKETLAKFRLEALRKEKEFKEFSELSADSPEYKSEYILGILGFPIEYNTYKLKHKPIVTWLIGAVMVITTFLCLGDLETAVDRLGMIPAKFYRYYGFTFVSSFFLHAGILHLFSNLYFLLIFGDNVEDVLGKKQYILLIVLSAFVGDFLHIIGDPQKFIPCVGASAGISGILAYYYLRFPDARLGLCIWWGRFFWFRIPVRYFLLFWIISQILLALWQTSGLTNVSALSHLGGVSIGILFWLSEKRALSKSIGKTT